MTDPDPPFCANWFCQYGLVLLAGVFYSIALVAVFQFVRLCWNKDGRGFTVQKQLHCCVFLGKSVRASVLLFRAFVPEVSPTQDYLWSIFPTLCYFMTISLLLFYWVRVSHKARMTDESTTKYLLKRLHRVWFVFNLALFLVAVVIFMAVQLSGADLVTERLVEGVFVAVVSLLASLGFFVYGRRIHRRLSTIRYSSETKRMRMRQVTMVASVSFVCYLLRVPAVIVLSTLFRRWDMTMVVFVTAYLFVVEGIPAMLILFIMRRLPPPQYMLKGSPNTGHARFTAFE